MIAWFKSYDLIDDIKMIAGPFLIKNICIL